MEKKKLFDDNSSDENDDCNIKINKNYAQRYDEWREAEIKKKLEDRYGNLDEELSSSSSDDGDDPEELEKVVSKDFFQVISRLRKKDPEIYDPEVKFFNEEDKEPEVKKEKKKKEKPIYLRDYERKLIVERGGVLSDEDSDVENHQRALSPSLAEKEKALKESFKKILHSDSDNDDDGLLKKKAKTAEEKKKEEEDYIEWLRGRKQELEDKSLEESLSKLKEEWSNPDLDEGEKFLRDYVLNKRYIDPEDEAADAENLTDDDYQDEYMDQFERKFNFRFEEPDSAFLKRYPRTIENSVRKQDNRRKTHREEVKKRKEEEKLRQREELKVLKSLKRKEIMKRIEKLKEITGNAELGISDKDLEGEYDPEEHDKRMRELFNDDYYNEGEDEKQLDELVLPPLEEEIADDYENWDEYVGDREDEMDTELHCEDPNFIMDCDYDPVAERLRKEARPTSSKERRKLKRQSRFGTMVRKEKPSFDPNEKSFQEYLDEYYGIDYEDIVGGVPCRYKYRKVMPNSFGLTIEEILAADDKELNAWVSIKKAIENRPEHVELNEKRMYELKAQNEALKRKILPSLYKHENEEKDEGETASKKKKKKQKKLDAVAGDSSDLLKAETETKSNKKDKMKVFEDGNLKKGAVQGSSEKQTEETKNESLGVGLSKKDKKRKENLGESKNSEDSTVKSSEKPKREKKKLQENIEKGNEICTDNTVSINEKLKKKEKKKLNENLEEVSQNCTQDTVKPDEKPEKKEKKKVHAVDGNKHNLKQETGGNQNVVRGTKRKLEKDAGASKKSKKKKKAKNNSKKETSQGDLGNQNSPKNENKQNLFKKVGGSQSSQNAELVEPKRGRRGGLKHKKKRPVQNSGQSIPRDLKAENKERAIRKRNYVPVPVLGEMSDSRLKAYGLNPKKFKNKLMYG